jgi:hypothetical protein
VSAPIQYRVTFDDTEPIQVDEASLYALRRSDHGFVFAIHTPSNRDFLATAALLPERSISACTSFSLGVEMNCKSVSGSKCALSRSLRTCERHESKLLCCTPGIDCFSPSLICEVFNSIVNAENRNAGRKCRSAPPRSPASRSSIPGLHPTAPESGKIPVFTRHGLKTDKVVSAATL